MISDIEIGELIGSVKALEKTVAMEREYNHAEFAKLHNKLDAFITSFRDMQRTSEEKAKADYRYLDEKIENVSMRVKDLERIQEKKDKGFLAQVKKTALTVVVTATTSLLLAVLVYLLLEYVKKGNAP